MRRSTLRLLYCLGLVATFAAGCAADRPPEETTPDGLVRVPARSIAGVYRAPEATFFQYRRIILEPPSISFVEDWIENHPKVSPTEIARMRTESLQLFREEFAREFIRRGSYKFADDPAPDVLLVVPVIEEFDIRVPDAGEGTQTYVNGRPVTMKVTGDLRDALTGKVVGRVITYHLPEQSPHGEMQLANRSGNALEQRKVFAEWSLIAREAIDVAKAAQPRAPQPSPIESK